MIIPIGCDHAGFKTKELIVKHLINKGLELKDWVYASKGIFYDKKNMKKILNSSCDFYNHLRDTELIENEDIKIFYE